jgi:hypothetical protein
MSSELARRAERGLLIWKARRETFWVLVLDGRETGGTGETSERIGSGMSQRRKSVRLHQELSTQNSALLCPSRVGWSGQESAFLVVALV